MSELVPYLSQSTAMSEPAVIEALRTAPRRYRSFYVKSGTSRRLVSDAPPDLKAMQKALVKFLRPRVPIHSSATAFEKGSSIRANAAMHAGNSAMRSFDFQDFFPSLVAQDWIDYCRRRPVFAFGEDVDLSVLALFKEEGRGRPLSLAQGTSTSPFLANVLMYEFDLVVCDEAARHGITYTRYADDLTFSAPDMARLAVVDGIVEDTLAQYGGRNLRLNLAKTKSAMLPGEMAVTGLVVCNGHVGISAERKKKVSAQIEAALNGKFSSKQMMSLKGLLAFVNGAEPEFLGRLAERYGQEAIGWIQTYQPPALRSGQDQHGIGLGVQGARTNENR